MGLGWVVCGTDAWVTTRGAERQPLEQLLFVAAGAGLGVWTGVMLGLLLVIAVTITEAIDGRLGVSGRLVAATSTDAADRTAVVRFHAWLATALITGVLAVGAFAVFLRATSSIMEDDLRTLLVVLAAAVSIAGTLAGTAALLPLSCRVLSALDRRWRLPLPRQRPLRFVAYQLVPGGALALFLLVQFGVQLGLIMNLLGVLLFVGLARGAALIALELAAHLGSRAHRRRWLGTRYGLDALAGGFAIASLVILQDHPAAADWASRGVVLPFALEAAQSLSDVDADGVSSLFGGRDCAPLDSRRSPASHDAPDNGIDEDCDGQDAQALSGSAKPRVFHGALEPARVKRYNVLWLIVDSLRPDHLPLYGYGKLTSPALSRLGKEAWVFDDVVSQSSNTALSVPSMFSGRWPSSLEWARGPYPKARDGEHFIARVLSREGYYTALVMNHVVSRKIAGIQHGFGRKLVAPARANWRSSEYAWSNTQLALSEAARAKRPFFIAVHIDDVHHPYTAYRGRAVADFPNPNKKLRHYDRGIAVFDQTLAHVVVHLKNARLWDDTILIVTSDHGEEFGEHGQFMHSRTCHTESVRVPLVMHVPGFAPARISARAALVDVVPTLLELLGFERSAPEPDGQSLLVPVLEPRSASAERPIFCTILQMQRGLENFFTRSVRTGHHALIHEMFTDRIELYDLESDPGEHDNLAHEPAQRARVDAMRAILNAQPQGNLFEARTFR